MLETVKNNVKPSWYFWTSLERYWDSFWVYAQRGEQSVKLVSTICHGPHIVLSWANALSWLSVVSCTTKCIDRGILNTLLDQWIKGYK